ncbi:Integrase core domain-containing protein [Streptomyces sp. BpilaLS-43]|uniref:DDE-type integrase/transposase/recombinase n=1 Tax=Streptomyces sp. BpilaLS-43 TaxID=1839778 RepID=UPI00081B8B76|nr:DDE-type integrase/transposase/recombinase [Streptomyces sp. BpilaLS-43]SCD32700.1 Integrase core domain-containing protein [Streptomyces sp. BpilaLS-43]
MTVDPFIEAEKRAGHIVKRTLELTKVSRSAYHQRRQAALGPEPANAELTLLISRVHAHSRGTYGAPRIHAALKPEGHSCGRRRVTRLMRAVAFKAATARRGHRTTIPDPRAGTRPDLVRRDFQPDFAAVDSRWCGDITCIPTGQGWLDLATGIDIASRRVAGWASADHPGTGLVADALTAACHQRRCEGPVVFHSDRGSQARTQSVVAPDGFMGLFNDSYWSVASAVYTIGKQVRPPCYLKPSVKGQRVAEQLGKYPTAKVIDIENALNEAAQQQLLEVKHQLVSVEAPEWLHINEMRTPVIAPRPQFEPLD